MLLPAITNMKRPGISASISYRQKTRMLRAVCLFFQPLQNAAQGGESEESGSNGNGYVTACFIPNLGPAAWVDLIEPRTKSLAGIFDRIVWVHGGTPVQTLREQFRLGRQRVSA
jgi:hypothetical protein